VGCFADAPAPDDERCGYPDSCGLGARRGAFQVRFCWAWRLGKAEKPCARIMCRWGGSSAGRASRSQCEGREFDPPLLHQQNQRVTADLPVTLLCFCRTCNRCVTEFDQLRSMPFHVASRARSCSFPPLKRPTRTGPAHASRFRVPAKYAIESVA
jgi:hypothetical protein